MTTADAMQDLVEPDNGLRNRRHRGLKARLAALKEVQSVAYTEDNDALYDAATARKADIRNELQRRVVERHRRDAADADRGAFPDPE